MVLEKEATLASHQTGHNSGVIHAGLYYEPGSLKAQLCREGKRELEAYCDEHGIKYERRGKLVVALDESELPRFEALRQRALENEVPGIEVVGPERLRELEPHAAGIKAIWSPSTGVVDYLEVAKAFATDIEARGATIHLGRAVTGIERRGDEMVVRTDRGDVVARRVIACAGLQADRVADMDEQAGTDKPSIVPFRGDYYTLKPEARHLVRSLIYPVPDPRFPFLGVHLTRRMDGQVLAGPNAVLATAREGYRRRDISPAGSRRRCCRTPASCAWPVASGRPVSSRCGATGRSAPISPRSAATCRRLSSEHLVFGPSGVRAQALRRDGSLVDDFLLGGSDRVLHVFNAPSPAATSSLAIGRTLAAEAIARFGL